MYKIKIIINRDNPVENLTINKSNVKITKAGIVIDLLLPSITIVGDKIKVEDNGREYLFTPIKIHKIKDKKVNMYMLGVFAKKIFNMRYLRRKR